MVTKFARDEFPAEGAVAVQAEAVAVAVVVVVTKFARDEFPAGAAVVADAEAVAIFARERWKRLPAWAGAATGRGTEGVDGAGAAVGAFAADKTAEAESYRPSRPQTQGRAKQLFHHRRHRLHGGYYGKHPSFASAYRGKNCLVSCSNVPSEDAGS